MDEKLKAKIERLKDLCGAHYIQLQYGFLTQSDFFFKDGVFISWKRSGPDKKNQMVFRPGDIKDVKISDYTLWTIELK